ncbi:mechanosensitive ion channel family protein [Halospeciosus flavus]|uniref:Mechanosensitive ion channel family protein n=1 Tax=Halospeciosus flavus TaxID=3032283 RepID=A0ABD5Z1H4_9EURY|nr:mechanosensitive ion channel family protein [Halospeciosus flavus]
MLTFVQRTLAWFEAAPGVVQLALATVVTFVIGYTIGKPLIGNALRYYGASEPACDAAEDTYTVLLAVGAIAVGLEAGDVSATPTATGAVLAAATLSAGIGAREILRNLVSGLFLVNNEDVDVGSWIEWDGHAGVVEAVSLRVTKIRTFDGETVVVPNSKLTDNVVVNPASSGKLRLHASFGIGYQEDIETARECILEEARSIDGVASDPAPEVRVSELGSSAVGLDARVWLVDFPEHGEATRVHSQLLERVKSRFQEENITMPVPQREIDGSITVTEAGK